MNTNPSARRPDRRRQAPLSLPDARWSTEATLLRVRLGTGKSDLFPLREASLSSFESVEPWRISGYYVGQQNKAGWYWSVTNKELVPYESNTELAFLVKADMEDDAVKFISQPFQMVMNAKRGRTYVPDFLIVDNDSGIRIVEVKARSRLEDKAVVATREWAQPELEAHGWSYETHSDLDPQETENRLFLATYRRSWQFDQALLQHIRAEAEPADSFGNLQCRIAARTGYDGGIVRAHLLHLCWTRDFTLDLKIPLDQATILTLAGRQADV
jgi:hypothetical protein